jgi:GDP-4-dehydro-6-deoxy-D-mannose reductase
MSTALVTGAGGFAGSHLLDRLAGRVPVVAWHRPGHAPRPAAAGVTWQAVEMLDRTAVARAIRDTRPSHVYHLAGAARLDTSWQNVVPHLETNVLGTHHLLTAVRETGRACRVLVVTSAMVYRVGDAPLDEETPLVPSSPYGLAKLAQDQLALRTAHQDGLDVVLARPFNHTGPRQDPGFSVPSFAKQIALIEAGRALPVVRVGNLEATRDLSDVRDVVHAYEQLMDRAPGGRPYNICSGRAVRIGDVLDALIGESRTRVKLLPDQDRFRPNDVPHFVGSAARIRDEIGWTPHYSLAETLRDTLGYWRLEIARSFA